MNVKERILSVKIIMKAEKHKEFAERIGLSFGNNKANESPKTVIIPARHAK